MKLALGTVQFGLDYGINNPRGKTPPDVAREILLTAEKNGVDTIDTAYAYGESEQVIGAYLGSEHSHFKVISKLPPCATEEIGPIFRASLARLQISGLYGYLFHDLDTFRGDRRKWEVLEGLKQDGLVRKIGFSLNDPSELEYLLEQKVALEIVQVPYNVLDQRFQRFFALLREQGVEIHVRSVFLQGLLFKEPASLEARFLKIRDKLETMRMLARQAGVTLSALCINFAAANTFIDRVVIGVDSMEHLHEDLRALEDLQRIMPVYDRIIALSESDNSIIIPSNWEKDTRA